VSLFAAANDLPDGRELEALFDRFLLRFDVQYLVRPSNLRAILTAPDPTTSVTLSMDTLRQAQRDVAQVKVSDATIDALIAIRDACKVEGIVASDRRWKKSLKAVQASAYLAGEITTTPEDLFLLTDCLWREPKERSKVARLVGELADPVSAQAAEILDAARETAARATAVRSSGSKDDFVAKAAQALDAFRAQQKKLGELARGAGPRAAQAIVDATQEINALHSDLARSLSAGLGLSRA
jgi:MoxR-like ATPase